VTEVDDHDENECWNIANRVEDENRFEYARDSALVLGSFQLYF
jgi:hypothetical protein